MATINRALYKRQHGDELSRRERKALAQHDADDGKRDGLCSYKANRSRIATDFHIDYDADILVFHWRDYNDVMAERKAAQ